MKLDHYSYRMHGFNRQSFEQALPEIEHCRQQHMLLKPCGFLVRSSALGSFLPRLIVPAPVALLLYLPTEFDQHLDELSRTVPSFCGLTAYYGLNRWTSFGWNLPAVANYTGFEYIRIDPEPLSSLHIEIAGGEDASDVDYSAAVGLMPILFVCRDTLVVSVLTIDEDWSSEFQGCDFISSNFNPRYHIGQSQADSEKARTKMEAILAMEPDLAELFLEDCRPKLTPVFDLRSKS